MNKSKKWVARIAFAILAGMTVLSFAGCNKDGGKLESELVGSTYAGGLGYRSTENKEGDRVAYTQCYSFLSNGDGIFYEKLGPSKTLAGYFRWSDGMKNYESDVAPTTPNSKWHVEKYTPKKWDKEKEQYVVDKDDDRDREIVMTLGEHGNTHWYYKKSDATILSSASERNKFIKQ